MELTPEQQQKLDMDLIILFEKMSEVIQMAKLEFNLTGKLTDEAKIWVVKNWQQEGYLQKPVVVEKIVEREKKSTPEQLEYAKHRREFNKYQNMINAKEIRIQNKIEKAKERKEYWCLWCKKRVRVNDWKAELVQKRNRTNRSIKLIGNCSECNHELRSWGGFVES